MIELENDALVFRFPDVHEHAELRIDFQRTLRIPDDDRDHPLPPGLGSFPLRHVDDFTGKVPDPWERHGGVMLPMFQAEALWLNFTSRHDYPFAVKVAAGKINAVTGADWSDGLQRRPQDYMTVPGQPWLDGFCVSKGTIRQFVAMPLGSGYSAEEQITGAGEHGGIQIIAYPIRAQHYRAPKPPQARGLQVEYLEERCCLAAPDMALAPGGRMRQEIYEDRRPLHHWDQAHSSRCFVHLANSLVWRAITGDAPPTIAPTAQQYTAAGLPWFEYYGEGPAVTGSPTLAGLDSVAKKGAAQGETPLPENDPMGKPHVVQLGTGRVREGAF